MQKEEKRFRWARHLVGGGAKPVCITACITASWGLDTVPCRQVYRAPSPPLSLPSFLKVPSTYLATVLPSHIVLT
jgi:hypothetical protein